MANALDYLKWRGDISFNVSPFNQIDCFICSQLSTPDFSEFVDVQGNAVNLKSAIEHYFKIHKKDESLGALQSQFITTMLELLAETERFGEQVFIQHAANRIIQENTEQFCAITLILPDNSICVSYRGTDDTLIGWKEDCELATSKAVAAQKDAADYLTLVSSLHKDCPIRLCGHSKGGNLAISAAASVSENIQNRIIEVTNFDGPGFKDDFLTGKGYLAVKDKITTVLSQHSIVGTLLQQSGKITIVHSSVSGFLAHDGFYWQCEGTNFIKCDKLSQLSQTIDKAMKKTIGQMSENDKLLFIDELFNALMSHGSVTITDVINLKKTDIAKIIITLNNGKHVQGFTRMLIKEVNKAIMTNTGKNIEEAIKKLTQL